jgi:hypothetical protein
VIRLGDHYSDRKSKSMAGNERSGTDKLIEKAKEAVDRLAGVLEGLINGPRPAPALAPVRQPSPEEIRRHARGQHRY